MSSQVMSYEESELTLTVLDVAVLSELEWCPLCMADD